MDTIPTKTSVLPCIREENSKIRLLSAHSNNMRPPVAADEGQFHARDLTLPPIRRLVVLVPNLDLDEAEIARQVWELASLSGLAVLFFSLCTDFVEESRIQRRLITLAALTREPGTPVETHIEYGKNWTRGVKNILESGDVIICNTEERIGFRHRLLFQALESTHVPVWTLGGLYSAAPATRSWLVELVFWIVSVAILIGFFWPQVQIVQLSNDWARNIYLFLTVLIEIGLLWGWHLVSS